MQTSRFASPDVATRYPLKVVGELEWRRVDGGHLGTIALPPLAPDDIVVPSLAFDGTDHGHRFELAVGAARVALDPIMAPACRAPMATSPFKSHIDYFSSDIVCRDAELSVFVTGNTAPERYLLAVSIRPRVLEPNAGHCITPRLCVAPLSQLTAPRAIRRRICSPACIAMVTHHLGTATSLATTVADCTHEATGIYGVWPLAIRSAARAGVIGAVEAIDSLDTIAPFLMRDLPVVASIRFERGGLEGSPLERTHGHLVVVTGLDQSVVHVNDPAAKDAAEVPRTYRRDQFAAAWLRERGAAYLFAERKQ